MESTLQRYLEVLGDPPVRALVLLLAFYVLAKIVELIFTRVFRRIVKMSRTEYDDRLIDILHRPIASTIILIGATYTLLRSVKPMVAVCAVRTGCGKSQTTRYVCDVLQKMGKRVVVIRHPMPYGDLTKQVVQRFSSYDDFLVGKYIFGR